MGRAGILQELVMRQFVMDLWRALSAGLFAGLLVEPGCEPERRAFAQGAFDPNLAAHQFDQAPANRQSQARAAEFARHGRIGLGEGLK